MSQALQSLSYLTPTYARSAVPVRADDADVVLMRMPGLCIARSRGQRVLELRIAPDAPRELYEAVARCLSVRERVGGFAGLLVCLASSDPGLYTIHTQLRGCARLAVEAGWSLDERLEVFLRVARAVQGLHEIDEFVQVLSPDHVLLNRGGAPHVLGPGLCVAGSEAFQAPETVAPGQEEASVRSDVYCLGAFLHYLLTGAEPPRVNAASAGPGVELLLPPGLQRVLSRACHASAALRYESVYALLRELAHWREGQPEMAASQQHHAERPGTPCTWGGKAGPRALAYEGPGAAE